VSKDLPVRDEPGDEQHPMKQAATLAASEQTVLPLSAEPLDQRIIELLVAEDGSLDDAVLRGGMSEEAIRGRARALGVTNEFIKRCRLSGSRPAMRRCICCDARFLSSGVNNRLCRRCPRR
jgi:hypothetical protein